MNVPFVDLKAQYQTIKEEIAEAVQRVMEQTAFAGGPFVAQFEEEYASFCGCDYAVGVGSGTEALWLSLIAMGVGTGDEVITVPYTFIATAEAISYCGATPVFVDIDEKTYTMDPELIEDAITPRTKAIIPVHLCGQMADMDAILEIAQKHGLFVIEDACQAHGAEYKGKRAGTLGDVGCFSFYPGKNLGACGEAGAVVTYNKELAEKIAMLRDHGQAQKYYHDLIGWNCRMDGIQGAILSVKLKYLESWNEARRANARIYDEALKEVDGITLPCEAGYGRHVYHLYAVRVPQRDLLSNTLKEKGISCGIHYPVPVHLQNAYSHLGIESGSLPVSEACALDFLSLPMYAELTEEQIYYVTDCVNKILCNLQVISARS